MLGHDRLQVGHRVLGRPQRQHKLGPAFPRHHPQLVEPDSLRPREGPVRELGQSRAAPQAQRLVENRQTLLPGRVSRRGQGIFEPGRIQLASLNAQPVPAVGCDQAAAGRAERAPQPGDLRPQGSRRIPGQGLAPQLVDQPVCGDQLAGCQQQHRQHQALAGAGEFDRAVIGPHLDRAKQPVTPHGHHYLPGPSSMVTQPRAGLTTRC